MPKFRIYIINLDTDRERWLKIEKQLNALKLDFVRISGVNFKTNTETTEYRYSIHRNRKEFHSDLTVGEIGCYLSHIKCWQKIIEEKLDYAFILEDDIFFRANFKELVFWFQENFDTLKSWDCFKLGELPEKRIVVGRKKLGEFTIGKYLKIPSGTFAQVISINGARKLLNFSNPFYAPVDIAVQLTWRNNLKVFALKPYVVSAHQNLSSINLLESREGIRKRTIVKLKLNLLFLIQKVIVLISTTLSYNEKNCVSYNKARNNS